jgi:hypothetical protein
MRSASLGVTLPKCVVRQQADRTNNEWLWERRHYRVEGDE